MMDDHTGRGTFAKMEHSCLNDIKNKYIMHKFSVGLPMDASVSAFETFLQEYGQYLSSIYFSLPVGTRFYSRTEIGQEFDDEGAVDKLFEMLKLIQDHGIRTEWAVNNYGLTEPELELAADYASEHNVHLDEIVTLAEYGAFFRKRYPDVEMKYSFNNPSLAGLDDNFDTAVVGKGCLRDMEARHKILSQNKDLVLLLNNGCSFNCRYPCGDTAFCSALLRKSLEEHSLDYLYALQSFFPDELLRLVETDPRADRYRWKLSTRPLGIEYTKSALKVYIQLQDAGPLISDSADNYSLFCVMRSLLLHRKELHYEMIRQIKADLLV